MNESIFKISHDLLNGKTLLLHVHYIIFYEWNTFDTGYTFDNKRSWYTFQIAYIYDILAWGFFFQLVAAVSKTCWKIVRSKMSLILTLQYRCLIPAPGDRTSASVQTPMDSYQLYHKKIL